MKAINSPLHNINILKVRVATYEGVFYSVVQTMVIDNQLIRCVFW
jgi:hypothetical protein